MKKKPHNYCHINLKTINKKGLLLVAALFLSLMTFGQNYNDVISKHLAANLQKFNLLEADVAEWKITNEVYSEKTKITNIYIQQIYKGVPVFNAVSNISIINNKVIFSGNSFVKDLSSKVNLPTPSLKAKTAIIQVASQLKLGSTSSIELIEQKNSTKFIFSKSGISQENIPVSLVYQPLEDGSVKLSWLLNVYQLDGIHWWNVRVDASTGKILQKNDWGVNCNYNIETGKHSHTSNIKKETKESNIDFKKKQPYLFAGEQYNVFGLPIESPNHGDRILLVEPQNIVASPFGWHDTDGVSGAEYTITRGNNVYVQLDDDGVNATSGYSPDGGSELVFDFPLNRVEQSTDTYIDASLTNLFYVNNVMHDIWFQYGFDEPSGNFQVKNYGGGKDSGEEDDEIIADGQDSSGRNNANFSTPPDGTSPRMQMFIFDNDFLVNINTGSLVGKYVVNDSNFTSDGTQSGDPTGAPLEDNPVTANLALMQDVSANPTEGCSDRAFPGLEGTIAVIRRGNCEDTAKILLAQENNAVGVIMVNNEAGNFVMTGQTTTINIPAVSVTQEFGEAIILALENSEAINTTLVNYGIDGSLDNGVIAHEFGHGISNRLIGGPSNSNCMSNVERLGEGWSDYFGLAITMKPSDTETTVRGIGTFDRGQPITGNGFRQYPYTTDMGVNPFTFSDVQNQVFSNGVVSTHGVGSIWATMLWDLNWKMVDAYGFDSDMYNGTGGNNKTMQLVITGLKFTPCSSGFVAARDAILAADEALYGGVNKCIIWEVFARRGLGYNADSGETNSVTDQTASFDMPPDNLLTGCVSLSLNNERLKIFTVYPNPASTSVSLSITNEVKNATITIYDINGRKVYAKKTDLQGVFTISTKNLSTGIYVLKVNNETINFSKKILIN
jgi:extracellular elastinolytic metalloproteinase